MYRKKGGHQGSATGEVSFTLGSGFDEFEFRTELPIECLLLNESISEEEYREVWINTPKDEHNTYDIKIGYRKIVEGNGSVTGRGCLHRDARRFENFPF